MHLRPRQRALEAVFRMKHGDPAQVDWSPRLRWERRYFTPDEHYEALLRALVGPQTRWLDAGCGRFPFPNNLALSEELASRCGYLLGVDPDRSVAENRYVHERLRGRISDVPAGPQFDLVTLRMVAEHIDDPAREVAALARLVRPGGRVVLLTVFKWSPIPMVTALVPFHLHHPVKHLLWGTERRDTFPVVNRMNTRQTLHALFAEHRLREEYFDYLDDCRVFCEFRTLHRIELDARRHLRERGLPYPEVCLLGVYRAPGEARKLASCA